MTPALPDTPALEAALRAWVPTQRWYAAKGHAVTSLHVAERQVLAEGGGDEPRVEHLLVAVEADGVPAATYQVPLGFRADVAGELARWALPAAGEQSPDAAVAYDGLRDPAVIAVYARALAGRETHGGLDFRVVDESTPLPVGTSGRVLGAEQSNTSVVLGEELLLKVFRRVSPGVSPDLELHLALGGAGCEAVAPVRAWVETRLAGEVSTLAMAQDFASNSADGWEMALTSVRDLFAEADLHAEEVGTDFAGEATRIGAAVAEVHACLAAELGTGERTSGAELAAGMGARLDEALTVVPALAEVEPALRALHAEAAAAVSDGPGGLVQRVHGDLHLGQVLRTPYRWLVIDFEGEPATPLDARREPDSPLRDVAGMLRSFDYAAHQQLLEGGGDPSPQLAFRAREWAARNVEAFCDGYAEVSGTDPRAQAALLKAYVVDKAVYECVYEARNRPHWVDIPLRAIRRVTSGLTGDPVRVPTPEED
ncbi:phosphotransferase [Rhodococcus aerolatus]